MVKPKGCRCGGRYKKAALPPHARDGSRYFECDQCHAKIEQTANGYEFRDEGPVVVPAPVVPAPPVAQSYPRRVW